ncbi:MAG: 2-amino-4-hydroxy-6-hydroxymethyldihydropteridine diphosphokinase [Ignavibacteriales bacterium]|nr:MAG: 2-amino-4-hydroxy-6-hydroxymethyldihydropteridine diphosphokinase [Ignavibacteriales bacterium]
MNNGFISMTENIFLGIGSNKGDRLQYLKNAVQEIKLATDTVLEKASSVYESEPYGHKEQNNFYNAVLKIKSSRSFNSFCPWIKELEKKIGRIPGEKWGPREIDIDLIFFDDLVYNDGCLIVPHKEIMLRDFVLMPMIEIAPDFIHPVEKIKMKDVELDKIEKLIFKKVDTNLLNS